MASEQAMRAARAWLESRSELYLLDRLADAIDRETGLPELQQQLATVEHIAFDLQMKCDKAFAQLSAVEALHAQAGNYCAYCGNSWPCLTVCAARGEHE